MSREELNDLAALYALDLLEGEELQEFEEVLSKDPDARTSVAGFVATADFISLTAEESEPPPDLEDRILDRISEEASVTPFVPVQPDVTQSPGYAKQRSNSWLPWGVAAGFVLVSFALWKQRSDLADRVTALETEYASEIESLQVQHSEEVDSLVADHSQQVESIREGFSEQLDSVESNYSEEISSLVAEVRRLEGEDALKNLRIAVLKSQLENAPNAQAIAVWDAAKQTGRLTVSQLPSVEPDQDYQLWIVDPAYETPVSAGVFNTNSDGQVEYSFSGTESISNIDHFALSVESKGGNASPEGPIVLVGE